LCSKCYKDELQRKEKSEDNNAVISINKAEDETSNGSESKRDLGKESLSDQVDCKIKGDSNRSKCLETETELTAQGNSCKKTEENKEQDMEPSSEGGKNVPVQKKRKRCWTCKAKLELAQRELGNCRCSYVFCQLHRLPEQHNCAFDHKESGRQEARKKMVNPGPKKVGRSFQRIDE